MLKKPPAERLKLLHDSKNPQAQFLWAILRDSFHYAAVHLGDVAESARDIDFAMRWGFGTSQGPFELWQQAGWSQVAQWVKEDIDAGKALSSAPLPAWVFDGLGGADAGVHRPEGSYSAAHARFVAPSTLPVYQRQPFRDTVFGAEAPAPLKAGTEVFKNDEVRVWTLDGEVLIASITAKLHLISPAVIEGLLKAVDLAEQRVPGPRDLVARRRVLGRRQPRGADAGVHEERRQGHPSRGQEAAGRDAAHALRDGAGRRRGARDRPRRRLRDRDPLRAPRRGDGELHGLRRGRRRADAGRRRPDLPRAPRRRDGVGRQCQRRPHEVPHRRLHERGDGQGRRPARSRAGSSATCSGATSSSRTRTSCCTSPRSRSRR